MSRLVNTDIEQRGKHIYQTNQHFRRLANVMEHPELREFFDKYTQDWDTTKAIIMMMKIYQGIETHSHRKLTPYEKIAIVKDVVDDGELRRKVCDGINKWINDTPSTVLLDDKNRKSTYSNTLSTSLLEDSL